MLRIFTFLTVCCMHAFHLYAQEVEVTSKAVKCNGGNDGSILITILSGFPDYSVKLYDRTPAVKQKTIFALETSDTLISINNLKAKKYYILITDSKMQRSVTEIVVEEPESLTYSGYSVIKFPESASTGDGILELNVTGGNKPYSFKWDEAAGNQKTQTAKDLAYGVYSCEIDDKNNCGPLRPSVLFLKKPENN